MKAEQILGIDRIRFVEPEFAAQTDSIFNDALVAAGGSEGRLLVDEDEEPIAMAFRRPDGWVASSFLFRNPSVELIDLFETRNGEILEEERTVWTAAVREYFGSRIAEMVPPAIEDLNPVRRGILINLIDGLWGHGSGEVCADCCCGSGVGSLVLRELGYVPLAYDNDAALISRGFAAGRLLPEETMCIDATVSSRYMDPVPKGIGIMMGEINSFTREMWEQIVDELLLETSETLITVGTEKEAELIREWGLIRDRTVEIHENPADPIYDLWVCTMKQ
jgi:hypothetical protein